MTSRRSVVGVIGRGDALDAQRTELSEQLGHAIMSAGLGLVTGGLGGVMEATSRGAAESPAYGEGRILAIVPGEDSASANPHADWVIPSGLGIARNVLVVRSADAIIAIDGGAGTLSELALAWQLGKPVVALGTTGWAGELAGRAIDDRRPDEVLRATTPKQAVELVMTALARSSSARL